MNWATLYSTWKQPATPQKAEQYFIIMHVTIQNTEPHKAHLIKIGTLESHTISCAEFTRLVDANKLHPWNPHDLKR